MVSPLYEISNESLDYPILSMLYCNFQTVNKNNYGKIQVNHHSNFKTKNLTFVACFKRNYEYLQNIYEVFLEYAFAYEQLTCIEL